MPILANINYEVASDRFYEVLFERSANARSLLKGASNRQAMFMTALQCVILFLDEDELLTDYLTMLGKKHSGYNITKDDLKIGREALKIALNAGSPNSCGEDLAKYDVVVDRIFDGMQFDE
jgi:hemoglobin-like flavoprotein